MKCPKRHDPRGAIVALAIVVAFTSGACTFKNPFKSSSTPAASSTPVTETFTGSLALKGSNLYTFTVTQTGTVSITLSGLSPTSVGVNLGLGTPNGTSSCTLTSANPTAVAGSTPQISTTVNAGTYCVAISDTGNLTSPSTFIISIVHS
jgi:hypothetical protein